MLLKHYMRKRCASSTETTLWSSMTPMETEFAVPMDITSCSLVILWKSMAAGLLLTGISNFRKSRPSPLARAPLRQPHQLPPRCLPQLLLLFHQPPARCLLLRLLPSFLPHPLPSFPHRRRLPLVRHSAASLSKMVVPVAGRTTTCLEFALPRAVITRHRRATDLPTAPDRTIIGPVCSLSAVLNHQPPVRYLPHPLQ